MVWEFWIFFFLQPQLTRTNDCADVSGFLSFFLIFFFFLPSWNKIDEKIDRETEMKIFWYAVTIQKIIITLMLVSKISKQAIFKKKKRKKETWNFQKIKQTDKLRKYNTAVNYNQNSVK